MLRAAEEEAGAQVVRDGERSREGKDSEQRRELAAGTSDGESVLAQDRRRRIGRRAATGEHRHLLPRTLTQAAREGSAKDEPEHVVVLWCCVGDTATRLPLDGRRERARATSVTATEAVELEGGGLGRRCRRWQRLRRWWRQKSKKQRGGRGTRGAAAAQRNVARRGRRGDDGQQQRRGQ